MERYAMTLVEIARKLGVTRTAVWAAEQSALRKLRARPGVMRALRDLAAERQRERRQKTQLTVEDV